MVPTAVVGGRAITALEIHATSASFDYTSGSFIESE